MIANLLMVEADRIVIVDLLMEAADCMVIVTPLREEARLLLAGLGNSFVVMRLVVDRRSLRDFEMERHRSGPGLKSRLLREGFRLHLLEVVS